jgi:hypothetical protein
MFYYVSEIRGTMVHDTTNNFSYNRNIFFSRVLILSNSMAFALCSSHETQRFVSHNTSESATQGLQQVDYTGFSPHEAHAQQAFFGWIMPTIRTSEFTVLQIVGLDAAVVCGRSILPIALDILV